MKKTILVVLALTFSQLALAGDNWDYCSSADGTVKTEYDTATQEGSEIENAEVTVIRERVLKTEKTNCKLRGGNTRMDVYLNTTSTRLVRIKSPQVDFQKHLICESGGASIIPDGQLTDCRSTEN